jgi:hypothetical protein
LVVLVVAPSPGGVPSYTAMVLRYILMKRDDDELEGVRERIEGGACTVLISMQGYEFNAYRYGILTLKPVIN